MSMDLPPKIWLPSKPAIIRSAPIRKANFLPGMFPGGALMGVAAPAVTPVTRTATDSYVFSGASSPRTENVSFGSEAADRIIFLCISGANTSAIDGLDSVTIGGVTATLAVEQLNQVGAASQALYSAIYWAHVPTGTTGDTVLTFSGETHISGVAIYRVVGADTTNPIGSTNSAEVESGDVSASITPAANSATIATSLCGIASVGEGDQDITWSNITEDYDLTIAAGFLPSFGFASREDLSSPGSLSISASAGGTLTTEKTLAIVNLVPTAALTSLSHVDSALSTAATIDVTGLVQAGDLMVLSDSATSESGAPSTVLASDFTSLFNSTRSDGFGTDVRHIISAKISNGSETTLTGMNGAVDDNKIIDIYRGNIPITAFNAEDFAESFSALGNPASQVIAGSAATVPAILLAFYVTSYVGAAISPRTFTDAKDGETAGTGNLHYSAWKFYDVGETPADHTVDMDDEGAINAVVKGVLELS